MYKHYIGIDQYGGKYWLAKHPRKELLEYFDRQHAEPMYIDRPDDGTYRVGYIIAGMWVRVYGLEGAVFERRVSDCRLTLAV